MHPRDTNVPGLGRRDFLKTTGFTVAALAGVGCAAGTRTEGEQTMPFELPKLPYPFEALEPHLDATTMQIHHGKHHQAYVDNLNKALAEQPDLQKKRVEDLLIGIAAVPEAIRTAVQNNAGGHHNHSLFWKWMKPGGGGDPKGAIGDVIRNFGDAAVFKTNLNDAGVKRFGSGWTWLVKTKAGKFEIYSTANQDSPLMKGDTPILGIDVWEHAYYLKYQNRRADYLNAWWNVVNWDAVNQQLA